MQFEINELSYKTYKITAFAEVSDNHHISPHIRHPTMARTTIRRTPRYYQPHATLAKRKDLTMTYPVHLCHHYNCPNCLPSPDQVSSGVNEPLGSDEDIRITAVRLHTDSDEPLGADEELRITSVTINRTIPQNQA